MNATCSNLLRHVMLSTRTDIIRSLQTFSPLKYQAKSTRATTPSAEDMLRVWGVLHQDIQVRPRDETFKTVGKTIKGLKPLEIFVKRLTHEPGLLDRQPIFGDFMVAQVPSILKPAPKTLPITAKREMTRQLKRLRTKEESLKRYPLSG